MKILYVEDNLADADLTYRALQAAMPDAVLEIEGTLAAARERLAGRPDYDVVLADLNLPDGNGLDLLGEIREQSLPVAVVVLTSAGDEATVVAALKAGADDYLAKRDGYLDRLPVTLQNALARFRRDVARKSHRLRVLYAEHNRADLDLTRRHLAQHAPHISLDVVHTPAEVLHRLTSKQSDLPPYDVILMDYRLQGLNALEILKTLREEYVTDVPVVLVTGQGDEDTAAQALRLGAADYLSKHEGYLFELPTVLENAHNRAQLALEHAALQASEARFRLLAENAQDIIFRYRVSPAAGFEYLSPAVTAITGYTPHDFYSDPQLTSRLINPDDMEMIGQAETGRETARGLALRLQRKDGTVIWIEVSSSAVFDETGQTIAVEGIARDITERKRLEQAEHEERMLAEALLDTTSAINSTLDLNEVLKRILVNVGQVIPHDGANIMLVDQANRTVHVVGYCDCYANKDLPEPSMEDYYSLDNLPSMRHMVDEKKALLIPDVRANPGWIVINPTYEWIRSYAGAPISAGGEVIGLLNLDSSRTEAFSGDNLWRLQAFADQAAVAIKNAQLFRDLQAHSEDLREAVEIRTAELRHIKERVEAIINNSPDAILLLDPTGSVDVGNPAFAQSFGHDRDALRGHLLAGLAAPESAAALEAALKAVIAGQETQRIEIKAQRKNGEVFDAMLALAPIQEMGHLLGIVCSVQDISKLKEVERMKDAFVSNVSHELRTPITSIRLNQKLIRMNPDREGLYLERMEREVNRLNDLIEDLLRLSRLEQGKTDLDLAPVNLNDLVDEHVDDRSPIAESRSLTLTAQKQSDLPLVQANRGLLGQALSVLLTNALNYTPPGGEVTISTKTARKNRQAWVGFSVSDTGPGIPPEEFPHLFERFYRGKVGRNSGKSGTGLGLAIAQEIVARHQGQIEVSGNDATGTGVIFSVWLPVGADAE